MIKALISQRESVNQYGGLSDSLEKEYIDYFTGLGIIVFPVSNFGNVEEMFSLDWDLVILTGGGILPQEFYNYERSGARQDHRDIIEERLIRYAIEKRIPLIGICRGMQMINAYFGGKTSSFDSCAVERKIKESHPVIIEGQEYSVNNYHNDGVKVDDIGEGLQEIALDLENQTIEAYSNEENLILGIQWHPEREGNCKRVQEWTKARILKVVHRKKKN